MILPSGVTGWSAGVIPEQRKSSIEVFSFAALRNIPQNGYNVEKYGTK